MNLTKDEIKQIEQTADQLENWSDKLSYNPPCATKVELTPSRRYKEIITLLLEKTNIGAKVEKDFAALDKLHQEYEGWRSKSITEDNEEEFTILIDSIKGTLYDLAETFRQITEEARKERKRWIVKQIFYVTSAVVVFLAAMFTCLGYLLRWLEPIKRLFTR
jgi:hypothetical protein